MPPRRWLIHAACNAVSADVAHARDGDGAAALGNAGGDLRLAVAALLFERGAEKVWRVRVCNQRRSRVCSEPRIC